MLRESFSKECYEGKRTKLLYRFHQPKKTVDGKKYPLVLFLHGAGERGDNNEDQLNNGILTSLSDPESPLHDSYIVAPQCPFDMQWVDTNWKFGSYSTDEIPETPYLEAANDIVLKVIEEFPVDRSRVFVFGISMGGFGTWDSLVRHSEIYAGALACCGAGDPAKVDKIKDKTIYIFHGSDDSTVYRDGSREMFAALKTAGSKNVFYKELIDVEHNSWDTAYAQFADIKKLISK